MPSVESCSLADRGRGHLELVLEPGPQRPGQVGHLLDVADAAAVNPAIDLAGVERLLAAGRQGGLDLGQIELGQVDPGGLLDCGASLARDIIAFVF